MNIENEIPSCKKATVLMSKSMDEKLSVKEQIALATHLTICKTCCFCLKQITSVKETVSHYTEAVFHHPASDNHKLSDDLKQRIKDKLK